MIHRVLLALMIAFLLCGQFSLIACNDQSTAYCEAGALFLERKMLDSAECCFRKAIDIDRRCICAYSGLGTVYLRAAIEYKNLKSYEEAGINLNHARKNYAIANVIDPENVTVLNNLGLVAYELNQFNEAENYFKKVLELKENDPTALQNIGNTLFWYGKYPEALIMWKAALQNDRLSDRMKADIWMNIGIVWYKSDFIDSAHHAFSQSVFYNPTSSEAFVWWGWNMEVMGEWQKAIEKYQMAISLDSCNELAYYSWVMLLTIRCSEKELFTYKDRIDDLIKKIRTVIDQCGNRATYHLDLAMLWVAKGDRQKAMNELVLAGQLDSLIKFPPELSFDE